MNLSNLFGPDNKKRKRVGRGESSGLGKTCGKGHKGQKSRSGGKVARGFEGGQMPLQRRLPKKGFNNIFRIEYNVVNVNVLEKLDPSEVVTAELLRSKGFVKRPGPVKVLASGDVTNAFTVKVDRISAAAVKKIVDAGGRVD